MLRLALIALSLVVACGPLSGCGDDGGAAPADTGGGTDTAPSDADAAAPDETPDVQVTPDASTSDAAALDAGPDDVVEDVGGCAHPCINEFGQNDKKLCPDPKNDWLCVEGCCEAIFKCQTDDDCAVTGFDEGHCADDRFACHCDAASGVCFTWYCATAADCGAGETCAAGSCAPVGDASSLLLRVVSRPELLTPGATTEVLVEAYDPNNQDIAVAVEVTWSTSDADAVTIVDGVATGGVSSGTSFITATSAAGAEASVALRNVAPDPGATLTVIAVEEDTLDPVTGSWALTASADGALVASGVIPETGVISWESALDGAVDVHILGTDSDWVTWLGATGGLLYLPTARAFWGAITLDKQANVVTEETELVNANVLRGEVDFSLYAKDGELDLTLSSFPFAAGLFDFNLQTILGANVKRFFHEDAAIPGIGGDSTAEIPGGLTFAVAGPAIPEFVLAAPRGAHDIWTLGGRIRIDEVAEFSDDIFAAFGGDGINFGVLVSALVPLFAEFWTASTPTAALSGDGTPTVEEITPVLRVPMAHFVDIEVPLLPPMADLGYADALFVIGAAVTADGLVVPLGLNAGSDTADPDQWPPDGLVDGNPSTGELDPLTIPFAPLHSHLAGPHTRYGMAVVAASLQADDGDPRPQGGSAIMYRGQPGEPPPAELPLPDFIGFPMASTWTAGTRVIDVEPVEGADLQRVLFKGKTGANWTVWLNGASSYVMPETATLFGVDSADAPADRTDDNELLLVNSFDVQPGTSAADLFQPGGFTLRTLLLVVDRASFVDIL